MSAAATVQMIDVAALRVGMFVHLDGGWLSHPFPLSSFRLANAGQIDRIRDLGLRQVRWIPQQSDLHHEPAPSAAADEAPAAAEADRLTPQPVDGAVLLAEQRERARVCELQFAEATQATQRILDISETQPQAAAQQVQALCGALADKMLGDGELCIRLLNEGSGERGAAHAVNVGVVSMLMGRSLGMREAELQEMGTGALLHDMGKQPLAQRPARSDVLLDTAVDEEHVARGVAMARAMGLGDAATQVIAQHHEHADGSGYPLHIGGERMSLAASIVAMVNCYDNLCSPQRGGRVAYTPHEAVALLFARGQGRFDSALLSSFIRMVGVYPPGSTVQLTDSRFALVVGVNSSRPLKPCVLVHEPGVPREQALVVDLERRPGLGVLRSLRHQALPAASFEYLAPRSRVNYFFEPHFCEPHSFELQAEAA